MRSGVQIMAAVPTSAYKQGPPRRVLRRRPDNNTPNRLALAALLALFIALSALLTINSLPLNTDSDLIGGHAPTLEQQQFGLRNVPRRRAPLIRPNKKRLHEPAPPLEVPFAVPQGKLLEARDEGTVGSVVSSPAQVPVATDPSEANAAPPTATTVDALPSAAASDSLATPLSPSNSQQTPVIVPDGPLGQPKTPTRTRTPTATRTRTPTPFTVRATATASLARQVVPGMPFKGIGAQVQNYEYYQPTPDRIQEANRRMSLTRFPIARIMLRAWWYTTSFNESTGEPIFDFENGGGPGRMKDLWRTLAYLKSQKVDVIIGEWDDPSSPYDRPNLYGKEPNPDPLQKYNITGTDPRWTRLIGTFLSYAINVKGCTNIKYYNLFNEANMWYSNNKDYSTWSKSIQNLLSEITSRNLKVGVIGPDVTGNEDWIDMMLSDQNLKGRIAMVDIHRYVDDPNQLEYGRFGPEYLDDLRRRTDARSPSSGKLPIIISEAGLSYGKSKDSQAFRYDFKYGTWMSAFMIQAIRAGIQGVAVWDVDDAYLVGGGYGSLNLKGWGFWNALAGTNGYPDNDFNPRPWFYPFSLLARFFPRNSQPLFITLNTTEPRIQCAAARLLYWPNNGEKFDQQLGFGNSTRGYSWHLTIACVSHVDGPVSLDLKIAQATPAGSKIFVSTWRATGASSSSTQMDLYSYFDGDMAVKGNGFPVVRKKVTLKADKTGGRITESILFKGKGVVVLTTMMSPA